MINTQNSQIKQIITDLYNTDGYIKGYGAKLCRVMDGNHNPLYNINKELVNIMFAKETLVLEGMVYKLKK